MLPPKRKQEHVKQRKAVPEQNGAEEEPHGQRAGLNWATASSIAEQEGQDKDADPDQPYQPIALVERRLHEIEAVKFKVSGPSRFQGSSQPAGL